MKKAFVVFVVSTALLACASVESVREAPQSRGEERIFDISYKRTVSILESTLPALGLQDIEKQSSETRITVFLGTHGITLASWGEIVRVIVTEIEGGKSKVQVHWRHRFRDGLITSAPNWADDVFASIEGQIP